jgi:polysaccharide export outer membrane protein
VEIVQKAVYRVTVLGKVNEPGTHELPRGSTDLLTALAAAGGLSEEAGTLVEIRRQSQHAVADAGSDNGDAPAGDVQLASYEQGAPFGPPSAGPLGSQPYPSTAPPGGLSPGAQQINLADPNDTSRHDLRLGDGDVVHVFPRPERMIYVGGLVRDPGEFAIPRNRDLDLLQAVQMAGDKSSPVADKVLVIRRVPGRPEPVVIEARLSGAKRNGRENIRLAAGDVVSIEQTPATVVVDTLMSFVRVSFGVANRASLF